MLVFNSNVCIATISTAYRLIKVMSYFVLVGHQAIFCVGLLFNCFVFFFVCEKAFPKQAYNFVFEEEITTI